VKTFSLNVKILFVLSIFIISSVTIATLGLMKTRELSQSLSQVVNVSVERVLGAKDLAMLQRQLIIEIRGMIIEWTPEKISAAEKRMYETKKQLDELLELRIKHASNEAAPIYEDYKKNLEIWWVGNVDALKLAQENRDAEIWLQIGKFGESRAKMFSDLDKIGEIVNRHMNKASNEAQDEYLMARNLIVLISCLSICFGLCLAFFILRKVNRSIDNVISGLDENSIEVTSAAQQIASTSEQLSQASTEQASSIQETTATLEEFNSMVQKNSENAIQASEISDISKKSAERGKDVVQNMIQSIQGIQTGNQEIMTQISETNQKVSDITAIISEIGNKTKVINDIVFQTKLLSFNASVEAARAGEHGKGFAVVAEEVGNLAQMSGKAAQDISSMLEASIQKVNSIVDETKTQVDRLMHSSQERIQTGTQVAQDCGEVLNEIVTNVSKVAQRTSEISSACLEQAKGVQEITKAMSQLDQVTQENTAASEQSARSAKQLSTQSESLRGVVTLLIETIKGTSHEPAKAHSKRETQKPRSTPPSNVVQLEQPKAKKNAPAPIPVLKKAVGAEGTSAGLPHESDSRFTDL
jgi:methyl-accepting chemotaxis protein